MCKLKGETPQEGINRRQSGDSARHGGQMARRRAGSERVQPPPPPRPWGRGWDGLGSLIRASPGGSTWLITGATCGGTSGLEVGGRRPVGVSGTDRRGGGYHDDRFRSSSCRI